MLPLRDEDRVRILTAVARKGPPYAARRVVVITLSLAILLAVPLLGLARVDVWGGAHRLLGRPATAVEGLQGIVVALGVIYGVTFVTNTFFGRFFCGWGCPVGYVSRLGEDVDLRKRSLPRWILSHAAGAGFVATFVAAVMLWWVDPRVLLDGSWTARAWTLGVFAILTVGGFLHAFVWRFGFCLHACPIGLYYRYVTSRPAVGIVFSEDPDPCVQCGACTKVCPVDLDPRDLGKGIPPKPGEFAPGEEALAEERYGDAECLRCGDCVEACRMVFLVRPSQTAPLRFGVHAKSEPGLRVGGANPRPKLDAPTPPMSHLSPSGEPVPVRAPSPGDSRGAPGGPVAR